MTLLLRAFVAGLVSQAVIGTAAAQIVEASKRGQHDSFRQLEELLPTPNAFRTASGAPGRDYWQQQANYEINVELDDELQQILGAETITYFNNSPDPLRYVWLQLDNNIFAPKSDASLIATAPDTDKLSYKDLKSLLVRETFDGGVNVTSVRDVANRALPYTIVKTMMRVDLPEPLQTGDSFTFSVDWYYRITNAKTMLGRTGYEYFKKDDNYIYEIAHWFPRMVAYSDATGWQHKQFVGRGEFTLELGDYLVRITVPDDHIVGATGVLLNPTEVLTADQQQRLKQAEDADKPVFIVTPEEAQQNQETKPTGKKTWIFKADNVRDFAFASSRKFIWDAQLHEVEGNRVMAMSLYPNEGEPLWSQYSTHAIIHTLNVYSRYTFPYPYPVAYSVNGPVYGMEYPMICFNGPRPEEDGTYTKRIKYGLISVIIHEVGHNYFPMIVNSDERQWTWMDEGLNTFLQYLSEQEWEEGYPSRRGEAKDITQYMADRDQVPIMTNSESILQFGNNAYAKPATALNVLRETILGRELFDYAFKEYARRWRFKRPMPADFFRTMEDASGIDLDWFFRGWFFTTNHTDLSIEGVRLLNVDTRNPDTENELKRTKRDAEPETVSEQRNKPLQKRADVWPELKDFYNDFDALDVTERDRKEYRELLEGLSDEEKELLESKQNFYVVDFKNVGGLVMPILLQIDFTDGSSEELRIPAEIWRRNNERVAKLIITEKTIDRLRLDPHLETADVDVENNFFPRRIVKSRFKLFKEKQRKNEMQKAKAANDE